MSSALMDTPMAKESESSIGTKTVRLPSDLADALVLIATAKRMVKERWSAPEELDKHNREWIMELKSWALGVIKKQK